MPFTNGDFETGDFTGWNHGGSDTNDAVISTASKLWGTYGCEMTPTGGGGSNCWISQEISTAFDVISLYCKLASFETDTMLSATFTLHDDSHADNDWEYEFYHFTNTTTWMCLSFTKSDVEATFPAGWHWNESGLTTVTIKFKHMVA